MDDVPVECLICAEPCRALGVFPCGHFTCAVCALRQSAIGKKSCPVCRGSTNAAPSSPTTAAATAAAAASASSTAAAAAAAARKVIVTRRLPLTSSGELADTYPLSSTPPFFDESKLIRDNCLDCLIDGTDVAVFVSRLYEFLCPVPACWHGGAQDPFLERKSLAHHLRADHSGSQHCAICLEHRPVFLCEQPVFTDKELAAHNNGHHPRDPPSFQGHPACRFCNNRRFYDGEHLLKHMRDAHFTCDECNRGGQFTFTFYKNRDTLIDHFLTVHKLCDHPDCVGLDPMARVYRTELDLALHKQKAHGARPGSISPEALGFRFGAGEVTVGRGGGGGGAAPASSTTTAVPATGANSHAAKLTFDFVHRVEVTELLPTTTRRSGGDAAAVSLGLPDYYLPPGSMPILTVKGSASSGSHHYHHHQSTAANGGPSGFGAATRATQQQQQQSGGKKGGRGGGGGGGASAASAASTMFMSVADAAAAQALPASAAEREALLNDKLRVYLGGNQRMFRDFRDASGQFISGRLLAAHYYDALKNVFFASPGALDDIFPVLAATLTDDEKRQALLQVRQMRTAPELLRLEAAAAKPEDPRVVAQREAAERLLLKRGSAVRGAKGGGGGGGPQSVWGAKTAAQVVGGGVMPPSPSNMPTVGATFGASAATSARPTGWGGGAAAPAVGLTAHADPSDFPSLPTSGGGARNRNAGAAAPGGKKNNAWFPKPR